MSSSPNRNADRSAAVTLDVPPGVADEIETLLRSFAEEAELDTGLVVDHSGFLIAGISSLHEVDVDKIGKLVAGASGATDGLTGALGEDGKVESLHLGEDRLFYLREVGARFVLVGVTDSNIPAGILRDQARRIDDDLTRLLIKVKAIPKSLTQLKPEPVEPPAPVEPEVPDAKSLRQPLPPPEARPQPPSRTAVAKVTRPKRDPIPSSIFEFDDSNSVDNSPFSSGGAAAEQPIEPEVVKPQRKPVVENSPFEFDEEDDDYVEHARPATTPVHISVPAARKRELERRESNEDERQTGPKYSFELG